MSLNATRWSKEELTGLATADEFSEALDRMTVFAGWHDDPATGESLLIEAETVSVNQLGQLIRRDVIRNTYDAPGTPPLLHARDTYARPYLPSANEGRAEILVETERDEYHPWTYFQQGSPNLSRKRLISGYVVYDLSKRGTALTAEERAELEEKGINPDGNPEIVVDSARLWSEANHLAEVVESPTAPQVAKWVDPFESEFEIVFEEPDKYTIYSYRKNHLRPQDMKMSGPTHQRKPGYKYRLPVAIEPPAIEATTEADDGIRLTVTAGGATVLDKRVQPERYRILRKTISSPAPAADPDPFDLYDTPPAAATKSTLWIDTAVTDLDGTPASALPAVTPYTEPGDTSEPAGDEWTVVAEIDNERPAEPVGYATIVDSDVINAAVYEYVATAIIGTDESAPSSPDRATYGGTSRRSRISTTVRRNADGSLELDTIAPNPELYGETLEFEIPVELFESEAEEFGDEIGRRHFADDLESGLNVDVELNEPLAILERGQRITTPAIAWTTTGNDLVITSETETRDWILDGFRVSALMNKDGELTIQGTTLYLTER